MASDLERKAKEAFVDDHFELAAELLTQAIALSPASAEIYADRAQANIKLGNLTGISLKFLSPPCLCICSTVFVMISKFWH